MAESTAASDVNIKPEHVTCEICLKCFDDNEKLPRTLPCHHSFCTQCLTSRWDRSARGVTCPKCQHLCPVEESIESSIAVSGMLKGMTEYMLLKNKPEQIRCHECPDNQNAAVRCVNCRQFMCSFCAKCHNKFAGTKEHKTVSLSELVEMPAEEFFQQKDSCDLHPLVMIDLFCDTCTTPVCSSCGHAYHKDHNIHDLNDVYVEKKKILSTALTSLQKSTTENKTYTATLNSDKTKLDEILKTRLEKIDESVDKLVTQIKNVSEEQKEEVRSNVARQKAVRDEKLKMIGQLEADRADHVTLCQQTMQFARQTELIDMCEHLERTTKSLLENSHIVDIPIEKIPRDDIFQLLQNLLADRPIGYSGTNFKDENPVSDTKKTRKILFEDQQGWMNKVLLPKLETDQKNWRFMSVSTDAPTYYETECVVTEIHSDCVMIELPTMCKTTERRRLQRLHVAEVGLCVNDYREDFNSGTSISKNEHAWCVQVLINTDNSFYVTVYSRTEPVRQSRVTSYSDNCAPILTIGWLLDTGTKSLHVIDVKGSKLIYSIHDVDVSKPLLPVYEVSDSRFFDVTVNAISDDNISLNSDTLTLMSSLMFGKK